MLTFVLWKRIFWFDKIGQFFMFNLFDRFKWGSHIWFRNGDSGSRNSLIFCLSSRRCTKLWPIRVYSFRLRYSLPNNQVKEDLVVSISSAVPKAEATSRKTLVRRAAANECLPSTRSLSQTWISSKEISISLMRWLTLLVRVRRMKLWTICSKRWRN